MIDWNKVRELRDDVGEEDFEDVLDLFLSEVQTALETLNPSSLETAEAQFHFLKGAALNLGFSSLAECCAKAEKQAAAGNAPEISATEVRSLFDLSLRAFHANRDVEFAA